MPSFILIHQTVWPQYINVTDREEGQGSGIIERTVLQTVTQKTTSKIHKIFCACYPWPWLSSTLTSVQYIMYTFRFVDYVSLVNSLPGKGDASKGYTQ